MPARHRSRIWRWTGVLLVAVILLIVFGSQYIRQLSIDPGPLRETAILLLAFTDSKSEQWLTAICVGVYFIGLTVLKWRLERRIEKGAGTRREPLTLALSPSDGERGWQRHFSAYVPEICLVVFVGFAMAAYAFDYERAYFFSDCLTLLAGITLGRAVAVWRLWRKDAGHSGEVHSVILPLFVIFLVLAAVFHPYMGRSFQYREQVRWMGPYFNPNTFGLLMGMGLTLALGQFVSGVRCQVSGMSEFGRWMKWGCALFHGAAAVACAIGLIKSYSRGAWMGTACGIGYLGWCWIYRSHLTLTLSPRPTGGEGVLQRWRVYLPGVTVLLISLFVLGFWNLRQTEQRTVRRLFSVGNVNDFSWRNRVTTSVGALQMMKDRPLLGFGWNQVEKNYTDLYRPPKLSESSAISLNDYFVLGVTLGLPALVCLLGLIGWRFASGHRTYFARRDAFSPVDWQMAVCRAALLAPLLGFFVEKGIFYIALGGPFWILLELGSGTPAGDKTKAWSGSEGTWRGTLREPAGGDACATSIIPAPVCDAKRCAPMATRLQRVHWVVAGMIGLGAGAWFYFPRGSSQPNDPLFREILGCFQAAQPLAVNVSPDGKYVLTKTEQRNGFKLAVVDRTSGREVVSSFSKNTQRSLTWRPDSRTIVYQDSPGMHRPLFVLDLESGKTRRLDVPVSQTALPPLRWDSRGRRIAYFQGDWQRGRLLVIDTRDDSPPVVVKNAISASCDFVWSPDGGALAVVSESMPGKVVAYDLKKSVAPSETAVEVGGEVEELAWSPDGRTILATVRGVADEHFKLVAVDVAARSHSLKAEAVGDIKHPVWLPDGHSFIYHVLSEGLITARLRRGDIIQGAAIGPTNGVLRVTQVSPDGLRAYARFAALTAPPTLIEIQLDDGSSLTAYSPPKADTLECPEPNFIRVKSSDGTDIPAYHWRASAGGKATRAALIVVHGGLHTQTYPTWEAPVKVMLEKGCDVIAVNYRGSSGYGQTFEKLGSELERVEDVLATRRYAVDTLKIPPEKVYLSGISSGAGLCVNATAQGEPVGGLVLVSSVVVTAKQPPRIAQAFKVVELHGDSDIAVSAERAQTSLEQFFRGVETKVALDFRVLDDEGHFFYKTESWAQVYWEAVKMLQSE